MEINCPHCLSATTIETDGDYICPSCNEQFTYIDPVKLREKREHQRDVFKATVALLLMLVIFFAIGRVATQVSEWSDRRNKTKEAERIKQERITQEEYAKATRDAHIQEMTNLVYKAIHDRCVGAEKINWASVNNDKVMMTVDGKNVYGGPVREWFDAVVKDGKVEIGEGKYENRILFSDEFRKLHTLAR